MNQADPPTSSTPTRMPVVFAGHGSPMNAIEDNEWSRGFTALGRSIPRPRAILAVSAHWFVPGTFLTANDRPETIHDFGGFPRPLYEVQYPAPGHVELARQVTEMLRTHDARLDTRWGLDHGTWSVLKWMFPDADVPVVQLSIDQRLTAAQHFELARSLTDLRDQGVLVLGSGNVVHNLRDAISRMRSPNPQTPEWAKRFDATVKQLVGQHDAPALVRLWHEHGDARLAHPSPDHWLPLLYAQALTDEHDRVRFALEGFDGGSIAMTSVVWDAA